MTVDPAAFRTALGSFCTGVTVISAMDGDQPGAITVSAFTSVSLDPPLILVCIDGRSRLKGAIDRSRRYAVSILTGEQEDVSNRFGRPLTDRLGFLFEQWEGLPVVQDALVHIAADLHEVADGGDHSIYIGRVTNVRIGDGEPLLYYRGGYHARVNHPVPAEVAVGLSRAGGEGSDRAAHQ